MNKSEVHRGRGATINPESRYSHTASVPVDDGWELGDDPEPDPATEFFPDRTVRLITRNQSPDVPFDRSINAYKGCEHGCIYCFARPTHAYLDLSPGLDFETKIFHKTGARERLIEELGGRSYECRTIAMGTNTDPYQPGEKRLRITRAILEVALEYRHPVSIVTKGQLILRDLDLLAALAERQLVSVMISVTTLSNALKVKLEPRTASPAARLRAIERLNAAGVSVGAMVAPIIPFINDDELETIIERAVASGAGVARYVLLRLPLEVKALFEAWLAEHYPLRAERVMNAVRQTRGGKAYDSTWGAAHAGHRAFCGTVGRPICRRLPQARDCGCGIAAASNRPVRAAASGYSAAGVVLGPGNAERPRGLTGLSARFDTDAPPMQYRKFGLHCRVGCRPVLKQVARKGGQWI